MNKLRLLAVLLVILSLTGCKAVAEADPFIPGEAEYTETLIPDEEIKTEKLLDVQLEYADSEMSAPLYYKIKSVTVYDNAYDLCGEELKNNHSTPSEVGLDRDFSVIRERQEDGTWTERYRYDTDTGALLDGGSIFVFEIELINENTVNHSTDPSLMGRENTFYVGSLFNLVNRSGENPVYGFLCYFEEDADEDGSGFCSYHFEIAPGQTSTIHLGYYLEKDVSEKPYSRMGFADEGMTSTYDDGTVFYWFDMSDIMVSGEGNNQ